SLVFDGGGVEHAGLDGVGDGAGLTFADDAGPALAVVATAQLDERVDRIHAGVLGERTREHVGRVGERLDGELATPLDARRVIADVRGDGDLARAATGYHTTRIERGGHDVEPVVERAS